MCGGFEQYVRRMQLWVGDIPQWNSDPIDRLNIRPTMTVGTLDAQGYKTRSWSLIPKWASSPKLKYSTFNARGTHRVAVNKQKPPACCCSAGGSLLPVRSGYLCPPG